MPTNVTKIFQPVHVLWVTIIEIWIYYRLYVKNILIAKKLVNYLHVYFYFHIFPLLVIFNNISNYMLVMFLFTKLFRQLNMNYRPWQEGHSNQRKKQRQHWKKELRDIMRRDYIWDPNKQKNSLHKCISLDSQTGMCSWNIF